MKGLRMALRQDHSMAASSDDDSVDEMASLMVQRMADGWAVVKVEH